MSERSRNHTTRPETVRSAGHHPEAAQMRLLPGGEHHADWELDERTRQVGLQGVAAARAILRRAQRPDPTPHVRKAS